MFPLLACAIAIAAADDTPDATTGWVKLFDGATTFGWKIEGSVAASDGQLVLGGDGKAARAEWPVRFSEIGLYYKCETTGAPPAGERPRIELGDDRSELKDGRVRVLATWLRSSASPRAVSIVVPAGSTVRVHQLQVRPKSLEHLLPGPGLAGWKQYAAEPKRNQATYSVTPAGELHILGGPGDLQSEKQFANFVLQGEFKTANAKVNSGVFFRCVPGEYQNGYECQIQNATINNDPTKPLDAGTGAIYRRVPARKVVSKDNEWFTLTVAADGPNICTWVNGEPVVAWTDTRPADANPRKGLRTAAGPISLQGHNPPMTADVLIRNLRIAGWE